MSSIFQIIVKVIIFSFQFVCAYRSLTLISVIPMGIMGHPDHTTTNQNAQSICRIIKYDINKNIPE